VVNRCFDDKAPEFCDLIVFSDGTKATPTSTTTLTNIDRRRPLRQRRRPRRWRRRPRDQLQFRRWSLFGGDESISLRLLASWLMTRSDTGSTGVTNDNAGSVGALPYADFKATRA
jgi:hypothetical protein